MAENVVEKKIKEIRIKKVSDLSPEAQKEVGEKLKQFGVDYRYEGYAKVSYVENSPLSVHSVDPIEGNLITYFDKIMSNLQ